MGGDLIQTPQTRWIQGAYESVQRGTPLMLFATVLGNVAAVRFSTLRLQGAATGYQVTAGKTLYLTRALFSCDAANERFSIGYSDADLGMSAAADGANPINLDSPSANGLGTLVALAANVHYDLNINLQIAAAKYPRLVTPAGVANLYVQLFGHEE